MQQNQSIARINGQIARMEEKLQMIERKIWLLRALTPASTLIVGFIGFVTGLSALIRGTLAPTGAELLLMVAGYTILGILLGFAFGLAVTLAAKDSYRALDAQKSSLIIKISRLGSIRSGRIQRICYKKIREENGSLGDTMPLAIIS